MPGREGSDTSSPVRKKSKQPDGLMCELCHTFILGGAYNLEQHQNGKACSSNRPLKGQQALTAFWSKQVAEPVPAAPAAMAHSTQDHGVSDGEQAIAGTSGHQHQQTRPLNDHHHQHQQQQNYQQQQQRQLRLAYVPHMPEAPQPVHRCAGYTPQLPQPFELHYPFMLHANPKRQPPFRYGHRCVRATACSGTAPLGQPMCTECSKLATCPALQKLVQRANEPDLHLTTMTNEYLTPAQLLKRMGHVNAAKSVAHLALQNANRQLAKLRGAAEGAEAVAGVERHSARLLQQQQQQQQQQEEEQQQEQP